LYALAANRLRRTTIMRPLPLRAPTAFNGTIKTLTFAFLLPFVLLLCCASTAHADQVVITGGGLGTPLGLGNFSMNPTAPGFSFSGAHMGAPRQQLCGPCNPGQQFGGFTLQVTLTQTFGLTYNGVSYSPSSPSPGYIVISSGNFITLERFTIPLDLSPVSAPFSFVGGISVNPRDGSAPFHLELTGSGIATFTFSGSGFNIRSQASFAFAPPQPTPEPATLLLLGTGLSGVIAAKVRRRRKE
jgi:hypothetical protein